ncbi:MAG TPA: amylo-alpha-1,6-glucosidase [Bryobacterales bacterium]|nr:amylo-alpha-1,6-glucosidase [Bryobacterales bacterium]
MATAFQEQHIIEFDRHACGDLEFALQREWLETNGLGGFASSTIAGCNTRRYHGLLIASITRPAGRFVLLSKLEETLILDGRRFELSVNRYRPGVIHPRGHRYLRRFRLDPFPIFTYGAEGVEIEKSLFMIHGENSVIVQYQMSQAEGAPEHHECLLELRPLIAFRDYHGLTYENGVLDPQVGMEPGIACVRPYPGLPALYISHQADVVDPAGYWYRSFEYERERERGLDYWEDLFSPFAARVDLKRQPAPALIASLERRAAATAQALRQSEIERRRGIANASRCEQPFVRALAAAADQFIAARGDRKTIIAGYHWFSDWGRDTLISLPGLTLVTGRPEIARDVLIGMARYADRGMLPNRFPETGAAPEYNTADASLWFFEAVRAFLDSQEDYDFVEAGLYKALTDIIAWHVRGTRYGIHVDSDGLLASGAPGVQLTWMDAKVGDWVVTPRCGKPVEIQALWYNALRIMEDLARRFRDHAGAAEYARMADLANRSFNAQFWNEAEGCFYDVINGAERDGSMRPNQVIALSLPHGMAPRERCVRALDAIERDLLTPYGLRTLSPRDPRYRGRYEGGPSSRDAAYHQGTVWPWLMGPFLTAYIKAHGRTSEVLGRAAAWLQPFAQHLSEAGLGQISEIFEGDFPHRPCGCIAQAWSVAELLRAAAQDVFGVSPAQAAPREN